MHVQIKLTVFLSFVNNVSLNFNNLLLLSLLIHIIFCFLLVLLFSSCISVLVTSSNFFPCNSFSKNPSQKPSPKSRHKNSLRKLVKEARTFLLFTSMTSHISVSHTLFSALYFYAFSFLYLSVYSIFTTQNLNMLLNF